MSCESENGSITITPSGGMPPYMFSIDGGLTFGSSGTVTGLSAGMYDVVVNDVNDCPVMNMVMLEGPGGVNFTFESEDDSDCDIPNGLISFMATSGVGPFSYSIDGGATFSLTTDFGG